MIIINNDFNILLTVIIVCQLKKKIVYINVESLTHFKLAVLKTFNGPSRNPKFRIKKFL